MSKSKNLTKEIEFTRKGIQAIMRHSKNSMNHTPPLLHLKSLQDPKFEYHLTDNHKAIMEFLRRIAYGSTIADDKRVSFEEEIDIEKDGLHVVADHLNKSALDIKSRIKNNAQHRKEDTTTGNRTLIEYLVSEATEESEDFSDYDWKQIELFEAVLNHVLKEVEVGSKKFKANDFVDLFMLLYVQPGMLYWTDDKKWLSLIREAGMGHYLFLSH
ncbi:MAG: hypothetical protein U0176_04160 [Bacteroidia bacterium]